MPLRCSSAIQPISSSSTLIDSNCSQQWAIAVDGHLFGAAAKCAAYSEEHTAEEYRRGAELTEPHLATPVTAPVNHIDRVAQRQCSGAAVWDSGESSDSGERLTCVNRAVEQPPQADVVLRTISIASCAVAPGCWSRTELICQVLIGCRSTPVARLPCLRLLWDSIVDKLLTMRATGSGSSKRKAQRKTYLNPLLHDFWIHRSA